MKYDRTRVSVPGHNEPDLHVTMDPATRTIVSVHLTEPDEEPPHHGTLPH